MRSGFRNLIGKLQALLRLEDGQDMVEYALVVALVAFAATAGIKNVATGVRSALTNISTALSSNIS